MDLNENSNRNSHLQELGDSNYQIVEGQPNIKGWTVKNTAGDRLGEVDELLFDPESRQVRYIVLDLEDNVLDLEERDVLIPIGIAELDEEDDDVILPNVTTEQLRSLPEYDKDNFALETEQEIRNIFTGRTVSADSGPFYEHEHFNAENLYRKRLQKSTGGQTVIGIFDNGFEAQSAVGQLKTQGFSDDQIDISVRDKAEHAFHYDADNDSGLSNFFSHLFTNEDEKAHFTEVAKRGSVVSVHVNSSEEAQKAVNILDQFGAVDVDERYNQYKQGNSSTITPNTTETRFRSKIIDRSVNESMRLRTPNTTDSQNIQSSEETNRDSTQSSGFNTGRLNSDEENSGRRDIR